MVLGLLSAFLAGLVAAWEFDLKKVVAFSTLSQLGFIFFSSGCVLPELGVFYLFIHAFFKSLLFVRVGYLIFSSGHGQFYGGFHGKFSTLVFFVMLIAVFAIVGLQFYSGFYIKHFVRELVYEFGDLFWMVFSFCCVVTVFYCFRLFRGLVFSFKLFTGYGISFYIIFVSLVRFFSSLFVNLESSVQPLY